MFSITKLNTESDNSNGSVFRLPSGAKSLLADDHLAQQDVAVLSVLEFLCECGSVQPVHGLLFKPQEVRRRLLLLVEQIDFSKALHLNMVGWSCSGEAWLRCWWWCSWLTLRFGSLPVSGPVEEASCWGLALSRGIRCTASSSGVGNSLCDFFCLNTFPLICFANTEVRLLRHTHRDVCGRYRQDQEICAAVLLGLLPSIRSLGTTHHPPEELRHVQGSVLQVVSGFWLVTQHEHMQGWSVRDHVNRVLKTSHCMWQGAFSIWRWCKICLLKLF